MRLPKINFPTGQAVDYYDDLMELIDGMYESTLDFFERTVAPVLKRQDSMKADADIDTIIQGLEHLKENAIAQAFSDAIANKIAEKFVRRVKQHGIQQIGEQVKAVLGFDPLKRDQKLEDAVKAAVKENVELIKSIPQEYHKRLNTVILQGVRSGQSTKDMKEEIKKIYDVTDNRAKFIARDQAGSMLGDITKIRHEGLGLKKFRWRSSDDGRVRKKHKEYDDNIYTWKDGAGDGEYPGKPYNCRCTAEIVAEELEALWGASA